ncbi:cadherin-related family member 5-like isoform X1 [Lates japonicus]|uniref:Cadherin-related family member 5-like isoform X1 n=1 Tax=Lates japonicus TaxID=270547 RepID=A0AAD3NAK1_LATJO|nr:cadherin-related family member 5-like isoform X1 [Lates japonicus]
MKRNRPNFLQDINQLPPSPRSSTYTTKYQAHKTPGKHSETPGKQFNSPSKHPRHQDVVLEFSPGPIRAEDGDRGIDAPLIYSDDWGRFVINNSTGELRLTRAVDDRRITPNFTLNVMVCQVDDRLKYSVASVVVRVLYENMFPPVFNRTTFKGFIIQSSSPASIVSTYGNQVLQVQVSDHDFSDSSQSSPSPPLTMSVQPRRIRVEASCPGSGEQRQAWALRQGASLNGPGAKLSLGPARLLGRTMGGQHMWASEPGNSQPPTLQVTDLDLKFQYRPDHGPSDRQQSPGCRLWPRHLEPTPEQDLFDLSLLQQVLFPGRSEIQNQKCRVRGVLSGPGMLKQGPPNPTWRGRRSTKVFSLANFLQGLILVPERSEVSGDNKQKPVCSGRQTGLTGNGKHKGRRRNDDITLA